MRCVTVALVLTNGIVRNKNRLQVHEYQVHNCKTEGEIVQMTLALSSNKLVGSLPQFVQYCSALTTWQKDTVNDGESMVVLLLPFSFLFLASCSPHSGVRPATCVAVRGVARGH